MRFARYPNFFLLLVKWPLAIFALCALPFAFLGLFDLVIRCLVDFGSIALFSLGCLGYFLADKFLFQKRFMGSAFSTFEHELTHAIFAWLTFHKVTKLKVTWNSGGMVQIVGGGNWLIAIAPYWFPTLCIPFMVLSNLGRFEGKWWVAAALGATYCYHLLSTFRETHKEQTDLQQTSFLFAWLFLPTANLIVGGFILAFAHGGIAESMNFLMTVVHHTESFIH